MRCSTQREPNLRAQELRSGASAVFFPLDIPNIRKRPSASLEHGLPVGYRVAHDIEYRGFRSAWTPIASTASTVTLTAAAVHPTTAITARPTAMEDARNPRGRVHRSTLPDRACRVSSRP